ncbi:MAG: FecR family protein, partial [Pseudomonadales bacterium]|nr:FecR family protein [Pseudomonadales bacterium]
MKRLQTIVLVLFSLAIVQPVWAKNLAGYVIVSVGKVTAVDMETQKERKLKRRSKIFQGDEIRTEASAKVQLKFKDKGVIALRENTSLQITEFEYTGHEGGKERSFFKLVKGGFRAISGAIGKQNQEDYRVETPLATIGIRGTHYRADFSKRLSVSVLSGAVDVSNSAGSLSIGDGFDFR